jgi:hypothetical protein
MQENTDRRKFPRYTYDLPVTFQTLAAETAVQCPHCGCELLLVGRDLEQLLIHGTARTRTLSLGGMAMELERGFAPGKQMLVQFPILNEILSVKAVVVVCQRSGKGLFRMGVEFLEMSEYQREVLVDYFADNLLKEARDRSLHNELFDEEEEEEEEENTDVLRGGSLEQKGS